MLQGRYSPLNYAYFKSIVFCFLILSFIWLFVFFKVIVIFILNLID